MKIIKTQCLQLINVSNNNYKFYNLSLTDSATLITRFGRIGTGGRTLQKQYENILEAELAFSKTISKKLNKGYKSVDKKNRLKAEKQDIDRRNFLEEFTSII